MNYLLNEDGTARPVADLMEWARAFEMLDRSVARTKVPEANADVSTVFLGLDHSYDGGDPVLWETMVFGGDQDGYQERYTSRDQALKGHDRIVAAIREGEGL